MFHFLIVLQALIAVGLVTLILLQQSEGGGLGQGGSPSGLMSARGAANFLTRATSVLAAAFVLLAIVLAVVAAREGAPTSIDTSFTRLPQNNAPPPAQQQPAPAEQPAPDQTPLDR